MDRYIVRERRFGAEYPQGNQMQLPFQNNTLGNNSSMIPPESMYYGGCPYGAEFSNLQPTNTMGYVGSSHFNQPSFAPQNQPGQGQQLSGIDPTYLAAYANNAGYMAPGAPLGQHPNHSSAQMPGQAFVADYQNRPFLGPERNKPKTFSPQIVTNEDLKENVRETMQTRPYDGRVQRKNTQEPFKQNNTPTDQGQNKKKFVADVELLKSEIGKVCRADKIKALHKTGTRVFSGSVENVLKWHKSLQDIGVLVLYELVAKCVNVRQGESCSKHLVIRDDAGPAMQVVYYEIDFLLPEIKPPCVVRIIGRMMVGSCRLQAFSVRAANGDDVTTLPRRSAIAAHHVAKLCKEFSSQI